MEENSEIESNVWNDRKVKHLFKVPSKYEGRKMIDSMKKCNKTSQEKINYGRVPWTFKNVPLYILF